MSALKSLNHCYISNMIPSILSNSSLTNHLISQPDVLQETKNFGKHIHTVWHATHTTEIGINSWIPLAYMCNKILALGCWVGLHDTTRDIANVLATKLTADRLLVLCLVAISLKAIVVTDWDWTGTSFFQHSTDLPAHHVSYCQPAHYNIPYKVGT